MEEFYYKGHYYTCLKNKTVVIELLGQLLKDYHDSSDSESEKVFSDILNLMQLSLSTHAFKECGE